MPAFRDISRAASKGKGLWHTGGIPASYLRYFPTHGYSVGGPEELLYQPGMLSSDVIQGLQQPGLDLMAKAVEQFGGGYGSARGGISGAGQELFGRTARFIAPQMALATQQMVAPALAMAYQAKTGAAQFGAQAQMQKALARQRELMAEYAAKQAARAAPWQYLPGAAGAAQAFMPAVGMTPGKQGFGLGDLGMLGLTAGSLGWSPFAGGGLGSAGSTGLSGMEMPSDWMGSAGALF